MNGQWNLTVPSVEFSEVGNYDSTGLERPASNRGYTTPSRANNNYGFRLTLYVK